MFLSIVIPVYNTQKYLEACIRSCLAQDIPATDYEIICVNDGSTDNCAQILAMFEREHANLRVITQQNRGISWARNAGLDAARGDYIWFVDSDDFIWKNCLGTLRRDVSASNADKLVFDYYQFEDALTERETAQAESGELPHAARMHGSVVWDALFRRSFLEENHIRFPDDIAVYGEDYIFRYALNRCDPSIVTTDNLFYFYRRNNTSATRAKSPEAYQKYLYSTYKIALMVTDGALETLDTLKANGAGIDELCRTLMPEVREISIFAAQLPKEKRREIMGKLSVHGLFPLFLYRKPRDYFPRKVHMNHGYMGIQGVVIDILFFYSTTRLGFAMMLLYYKLRERLNGR